MRGDVPWFLVIADPILLVALIYFFWHYIAELRFYKKWNWDFSKDNPKGNKFYHGEYAAPDDSNLMSNSARITFGYPFFLFVIGVLFLGFSYGIYRIQSFPYSDLKQCNIEVTGSEVTLH